MQDPDLIRDDDVTQADDLTWHWSRCPAVTDYGDTGPRRDPDLCRCDTDLATEAATTPEVVADMGDG